ncbi:GNAT family N-acetyltransferase [Pseudokineococcus sp. 1T1Z-3]|uniref:GNAT family N-acetyltransferase n=1 Tax=Pseudokineococcus sp. 1T1Z-3 TaxID=3132745 RepID=UPI0030B5D5A5
MSTARAGLTLTTPAGVAEVDLDAVTDLYRSVGWSGYADRPDLLRAALAGSTHVVLAHEGDELVGLARVVSDGTSVAYLQDLLVRPGRQRLGAGTALVEAAMSPFAEVRQKVLLTDDEPRQRAFYESLGYQEATEHPAGPLRAFVRLDA